MRIISIRPNAAPCLRARLARPTGEEYGACDHAVRVVQSVDGAKKAVGVDTSIASANREMRATREMKWRSNLEICKSGATVADSMERMAAVAVSA